MVTLQRKVALKFKYQFLLIDHFYFIMSTLRKIKQKHNQFQGAPTNCWLKEYATLDGKES